MAADERRSFRRDRSIRVQLVLLHVPVAVAVVAGGAAFLAWTWGEWESHRLFHDALGAALLLAAGLPLLAGLWWAAWIVRRFRFEMTRTVTLDGEGISLLSQGVSSRIPWHEIREVWLSVERDGLLVHLHGAGLIPAVIAAAASSVLSETIPADMKLRIVGARGEIELDDDDLGIGPAYAASMRYAAARLAREAVERVRAGETVRLGEHVAVHGAGLTFPSAGGGLLALVSRKEALVPWGRLERVWLDGGAICVSVRGESGARARLVKEIPNFFALGEIVRECAGLPIAVDVPPLFEKAG